MTVATKKRWLLGGCLALLFSFLLSGEIVASAVRSALWLCAHTVIPALFPFLVISGLLTPSVIGARLPGARLFSRVLHLPEAGITAFFLGALCGFPIGAKTAADLCRTGSVTREEGGRLAALSANTGPAFAVLAVGGGLFGSLRIGIFLYITEIVTALLLAIPEAKRAKRRGDPISSPVATFQNSVTLSEVLYRSSLTMLTVTGTVLFFASLSAILSSALPKSIAAIVTAFLEVGNGCAAAAALPLAIGIPLAAFAISFSGVSVLMQSATELAPAGIPLAPFFRKKLSHGLLAAGMSLIFLPFL